MSKKEAEERQDELEPLQEMLDDFNSIYLQKPIELLGQIGGRKTRRRLRRKSRKSKKRRKNRRRKTKRRKKRKSRKR